MANQTSRSVLSLSLFALALVAQSASAQVRRENAPTISATSDTAVGLFDRSGMFLIAGGVVLQGQAAFFVEESGNDRPIPASSVQPALGPDGTLLLTAEGTTYRLLMQPGLACPLSRFVSRGGVIAYTVPKVVNNETIPEMVRAGLVHHRVAEEFSGTKFEALLHAADFARTVDLPANMDRQIARSINAENGVPAPVMDAAYVETMLGSFINADPQVTYHVYLMKPSDQVEIGGVPLRYFWTLTRGKWASVFAVSSFAQDWPEGSHLSDLSQPGAVATQYDIVNFYQTAGLFRQLHTSNPDGFERLASEACR